MFSGLTSSLQLAVLIGGFVLLTSLGTGAYFWYQSKIDTAVNTAVKTIELDQAKRNLKLQERATEATWKIQDDLAKLKKENDAKVKSANASYDALAGWVRSQGSLGAGSSSGNTDSTGNATTPGKDVIGFLYRQDASDLAELGKDAEVVRLELLNCYAQYDMVRNSLEIFKKENAGKSVK